MRPRGDGGEWHEDPYVGLGIDDVAMAARGGRDSVPFDLSDIPNSQARAKRGLKGITGYGRNMVKGLGAMMNRLYPHHRVTFGTITLPPMSPDQRRAVVESWSEVVRQTLQRLALLAKQKGLPTLICSVSEVQPKRLASHGEGYLHLHLIWLNCPGRAGKWTVDPVALNSWFNDLLIRLVPGYSGERVNVDVKPVDGEVARYMAKYMSKGSEVLAEAQADWGEGCCPSTWWNMTATARKLVKDNTFTGPAAGRILETLVECECGETDDGLFAYLRPVRVWLNDVEVTMGWRGRMHDPVAADVRGMLQSLIIERF